MTQPFNQLLLRGLTWGHRRATAPLHAASSAYGLATGVAIEWEVRDLGRFEHEPLHRAAAAVDLVVFDHPFCGVIAQSRCFRQLPADWVARVLGDSPAGLFIGRSFESYTYDGEVWGLPVDGACNHAAYRRDLLDRYGGGVPTSWAEVLDLAHRVRADGRWVAMAATGHHGLLAVAALMANDGNPLPEGARDTFVLDRVALTIAIDRLRALLDLAAPESLGWNSIDVHDALEMQDDIVYCPIVYGFATYGEHDRRRRLSFARMPGGAKSTPEGAVLGGAAIGISANCKAPEQALAFLAFLASSDTQTGAFARRSGQPARIEAWHSDDLDERFNGFFSATMSTMERCSMRPRFLGYQQFEKSSGNILETGLRRQLASETIVARIVDEAERVRTGDFDAEYADLLT